MDRDKGKAALPYTEAQTTAWLSWLARGMQQTGETVFLIEKLQPSWLPTRTQRLIYTFCSRLFEGLLVGLILVKGLLIPLIDWIFNYFELHSELIWNPGWLSFGLFLGLLLSFADALRFECKSLWAKVTRTPILCQVAIYVVITALIGGVIAPLICGLTYHNGLILGLILGLICGIRNTRRCLRNDIKTVETLSWSWSHARSGCGSFLLIGLVFWLLLTVLLIWGPSDNTRYLLITMLFLILWVPSGLISTVFRGLRGGVVEMKTVPNQGIKLSIQSAILGAGLVGLILGVLFLPVFSFFALNWKTGLGFALKGGLIVGLFAYLCYGGLDVIQHYTLRLILYLKGYTPFNYVRFLDYATDELNFLQKVGGGYIFIHRFLLEHFAAMEKPIEHVVSSEPAEK